MEDGFTGGAGVPAGREHARQLLYLLTRWLQGGRRRFTPHPSFLPSGAGAGAGTGAESGARGGRWLHPGECGGCGRACGGRLRGVGGVHRALPGCFWASHGAPVAVLLLFPQCTKASLLSCLPAVGTAPWACGGLRAPSRGAARTAAGGRPAFLSHTASPGVESGSGFRMSPASVARLPPEQYLLPEDRPVGLARPLGPAVGQDFAANGNLPGEDGFLLGAPGKPPQDLGPEPPCPERGRPGERQPCASGDGARRGRPRSVGGSSRGGGEGEAVSGCSRRGVRGRAGERSAVLGGPHQ